MKNNNRNQIAHTLVNFGSIFGKAFGRDELALCLDLLDDLDAGDVERELKALARGGKVKFMPRPGEIRELVLGKPVDPDDTACLAAEAIVSAVKRYGYPWPDEARKKIGELGWRYVERWGGWARVCEELGDTIPEGVFVAQAKNAIRSSIAYGSDAIDLALERGLGPSPSQEIESKPRHSDLEPPGLRKNS